MNKLRELQSALLQAEAYIQKIKPRTQTMNQEQSVTKAFINLVVVTAIFIGSMFLHAVVLRDICTWFVVPLASSAGYLIPAPTFVQAFLLYVSLVLLQALLVKKSEKKEEMTVGRFFYRAIGFPLIVWGVAALLALLIPLLLRYC